MKKEGKYSSEKIESYFTLFESLLAPKSNPLLAVEELCFAKQGSMDSREFHAHVVKIAERCKFPCTKAEEMAIRDTIFLGMNSMQARDKAINLMNEEGKELTVEFLMQQLEVEDCNAHHKSLSLLDSSTSINSVADISILGQFRTYLEFRGEKYLNTFTNVNDCPNLLSYVATFRMGVLLPNYPEENVVRETTCQLSVK